MRILFLFFILLRPLLVECQVEYSNFTLVQQDNRVVIRWIVNSGSLCNGTTVWRSLDNGENVLVGEITGICGSQNEDKEYSIIDGSPELNSLNTYYVRFGFSEYSEEKTIYVKYLDPKKLYIGPIPSAQFISLEWNDVYHDEYTIRLIDYSGKIVTEIAHVTGSSYQLDLNDLLLGSYTVVLINGKGEEISEKIVKI